MGRLGGSVEPPTPGFGLGHDLTVHEFKPLIIRLCAGGTEPVWDFLSPFLALAVCTHTVSLKCNKIKTYV